MLAQFIHGEEVEESMEGRPLVLVLDFMDGKK